jgi:hypothetical protein
MHVGFGEIVLAVMVVRHVQCAGLFFAPSFPGAPESPPLIKLPELAAPHPSWRACCVLEPARNVIRSEHHANAGFYFLFGSHCIQQGAMPLAGEIQQAAGSKQAKFGSSLVSSTWHHARGNRSNQ